MFFSVVIALSVIAHSSDMNRDIDTTAQAKYHDISTNHPVNVFVMTTSLVPMTDANQPDTASRSHSESVSTHPTEDADTDSTDDMFESDPEFDPDPKPIEPERPVPEHILFVALGVLGTLGLLVSTLVPNLI